MSPVPDDRSFERSSELRHGCISWFLAVRTPIRAARISIPNT